jgi:hypothetical protein
MMMQKASAGAIAAMTSWAGSSADKRLSAIGVLSK